MSYEGVMRLPLRAFWSLNAQVVRLRAEQSLSMIELFLLGGMGASEEAITALRESLSATMGDTATTRTKPRIGDDLEQHTRGMEQLRSLKARLDGKTVTEDGAASA